MSTGTATKKTVNRNMVKINGDWFYSTDYDVIDRASLNFFEPKDNSNKFYIAEIHESLSGLGYRLYVNYGRVGRDGVENAQKFDSLDLVKREFAKKVNSKVKKGYTKVDLATFSRGSSQGKNKVNADSLGKGVNVKTASKLKKEVQDFLKHIYDEANQAVSVSMTGSAKSDVKAPLGNLGINGINKARGVLQQIATAINVKDINTIRNLSIAYYRNVPRKMPSDVRDESTWILNTQARVQKEMDTLDLYEDTLRLLPVMGTSDIDKKYMALNCDVEYIDKNSEEYAYILHKISSTHAKNHNYKLKVKNAYKIRMKNAPQFDASCGNTVRLFHGSRSANMVGILSSYLKLPNNLTGVVKTGAMFGPGIYFANDCTKSANYSFGSWAGRANKYDSAYIMIAKVSLGNVYDVHSPTNFNKAPTGYHSVKGCKGHYLINNEFIVYDPRQVMVEYVVEVEKV